MSKKNNPPQTGPVALSFHEWANKFEPIKNHLNANAPCEGLMFETYGAEFIHVAMLADGYFGKASPRKVWTLVENEKGGLSIIEGCNLVNRVGYLITAKPFKVSTRYTVTA